MNRPFRTSAVLSPIFIMEEEKPERKLNRENGDDEDEDSSSCTISSGPDVEDEDELAAGEILECPVCLQTCIYPVQLPCKHIFCFLCVKGTAKQNPRCALCRQEVPGGFLANPKLLREEELINTVTFDTAYQWFYEGHNGWWQYDDRASRELEKKFKNRETNFHLLIAGHLYVIDLEKMLQYRQDNPRKKRKVKRDLATIPEKKGVAGIKLNQGRPGPLGVESLQPSPQFTADDTAVSPPAPNNTPQSPANSPLHSTFSSEQDLSVQFESMNFSDTN